MMCLLSIFIDINHLNMNLIDGSISSYCSVIKSHEQLDMIKKENKLAAVLGDIESDLLGEKQYRNNISLQPQYLWNKKYEHKHRGKQDDGSQGFQNCTILDRPVLTFGMDQTKNLKAKDLQVLLCCHFEFLIEDNPK